MLNELAPYLIALEDKKRDVLRYMDGLSPSQRQWRPSDRELSPIQVLAHVVKVEETVAGPGTLPKPGSKVGLKGRIFMAVLVNMMRPGFRIPTFPTLHPAQPDSYEDLKRAWETVRNELASRVELANGQPITNHIMAGPLSAPMALDFLDVHLRYHWKNFPRQTR